MLNFTRSWGFGIFRVYWVSKSKCIISSNLRAEGSWGKVLNVVIFLESVVHRSNWRSRETETVGNSRKKMDCAESFFCKKLVDWQFGHDHAGPLPTVSDCFRLFPTVSDCFRLFPTVSVSLERQLDLWTTDSTKITTFNTFPHDPSARRLLEMMHFDFETQ